MLRVLVKCDIEQSFVRQNELSRPESHNLLRIPLEQFLGWHFIPVYNEMSSVFGLGVVEYLAGDQGKR